MVSLAGLPNTRLLEELRELVSRDRQVEADLLIRLGEVDARRLYLGQGCSSMFAYCTEVLHFSESIAYDRIQVARAVRGFPGLLERIRQGEIHLSGAKLLAPHLRADDVEQMLDLARHKSKRAIEELLADRAPKPDAPSFVREVPEVRPAPSAFTGAASPSPSSQIETASSPAPPRPAPPTEPLGHERYKVQFTASARLRDKLREAQALLRHQVPDGDLAEIFERALTLLVEDTRRKKFARVARPRPDRDERAVECPRRASRHIPAEIRRAVAERDEERCAYVARNGRRCSSRDLLEFHHRQPWAWSPRHTIDGIELRCRAHNHLAAVEDFGQEFMERCRMEHRHETGLPTRPGTSSPSASPPTRPGTSSSGGGP